MRWLARWGRRLCRRSRGELPCGQHGVMKRPVWLQELEEEMSRDRTHVVVGFVVFACGLGIFGRGDDLDSYALYAIGTVVALVGYVVMYEPAAWEAIKEYWEKARSTTGS